MKIGQDCWVVIDDGVHECIYRGQRKSRAKVESKHHANNDMFEVEMQHVFHSEKSARDAVDSLLEHQRQKDKYEREQKIKSRRGALKFRLAIRKGGNVLDGFDPSPDYAFHPRFGEMPAAPQKATATVGLRQLGELINRAQDAGEFEDRQNQLIEFVLLVDEHLGKEKVDELLGRVLT